MTRHGLGRRPFTPDARDDSYTGARLAAMIELGLAAPVSWPNANRVLDQGEFGTCVAAGTLGLLNTDDEAHNDPRFTDADIMPFFESIPGHGALPDGGAEIREGLKAAKAAGLITAYARLTTAAEVDEWLENHGPVLVGSLWDEAMSKPVGGLVIVGGLTARSGHCYFWHGQDTYYREGTNSWSAGWGERGQFKMRRCDDLRLQHAGGEAWALVQPPAPIRARRTCLRRFTDAIRRLFGGK
jgi:hypothetical protein